MIAKSDNNYIISDDSEKWLATHSTNGIHGPLSLTYKKDLLISECSGHIGSFNENNAVAQRLKEYHKSGESILEAEGFIPSGTSRTQYKHIYKYSNKRVKITSDVHFNNDFPVTRHFSIGSLFLPGKWKSFSVTPPVFHQVHDAKPFNREIPEYKSSPLMLGHWHRAPLSVTFYRPNGTALEIGTGSDTWRWDENLGYAPESGSYKITLEENGIRFTREPLACCEEFQPEARSFRFSWYIAWRENGALKKLPQHEECDVLQGKGDLNLAKLNETIANKSLYVYAILDMAKLSIKGNSQLRVDSPYDFIRGKTSKSLCWSNKAVLTHAKKIIRKLTEIDKLDGIIFKNFEPGICYNSSHVNKKHENGTAHWDINGLFDFGSWVKNHCKDNLDLFIETDTNTPPSMTGLFE